MQARSQILMEFNVSDILQCTSETVLMISIGKMLLYYCKVNNIKPKLHWYIKIVEDTHNVENYNAVKNDKICKVHFHDQNKKTSQFGFNFYCIMN